MPSKEWNSGYWGFSAVGRLYVLAFMLRNRGKFNRVIFQDLYDSIFQGDPFSSDLITSPNEIHSTHVFKTGSHQFMLKYYNRANITQPEYYSKRYFKNGSHYGGFAETMLKFMLIFMTELDFKRAWNDQITANYLEFSSKAWIAL